MIHWAWLILAFYVGAITVLLFGYWIRLSVGWLLSEKPAGEKPAIIGEDVVKPDPRLQVRDCQADEAVPMSGKSTSDIAGLIDRSKVPNV